MNTTLLVLKKNSLSYLMIQICFKNKLTVHITSGNLFSGD